MQKIAKKTFAKLLISILQAQPQGIRPHFSEQKIGTDP